MTANSNSISATGIGVSNAAVSKKFYIDVAGLEARAPRQTPLGHEEVLVDPRGNVLLLTSYEREHNYKKNPIKLVFAVPDVDAFYAKVLANGGRKFSPPQRFGDLYLALAYDPDGYVVEGVQFPNVASPVLVAVGIGVSDLDASADFYTRVLGMKFVRDIAVPGYMNEKELAPPQKRGPSLVLMNYEDKTRSYANIPTRLVLSVADVAGLAAAVGGEDPSKLVQAAVPNSEPGAVAGALRDLDGYRIELAQA